MAQFPKTTDRLPGVPYSRQWLRACVDRGLIDGYIIIDKDHSASILGREKTPAELRMGILMAYGVLPEEIYLPDAPQETGGQH